MTEITYLKNKLSILRARHEAQSNFALNEDMFVAAQVTLAEIEDVKRLLNEAEKKEKQT